MSYTKITPNQIIPNLCINCQYYRNRIFDIYPKCTYVKNINNVSGVITYEFASIYREFECKGNFYKEKKNNIFKNFIKDILT